MQELIHLIEIADKLLGPNGCSWDKEQTLFTLQPYLLEETHELIEAIDSEDVKKIVDEVGDVLFALVFISKLGPFDIRESLSMVAEKLIRRHPHVFGNVKVSSNEEIVKNWEEIKKTEKTHEGRKNIFDGIPASLPALPRAQKMAKKLKAKGDSISEEELGEQLWSLMQRAYGSGLDAESALRRKLSQIEKSAGE